MLEKSDLQQIRTVIREEIQNQTPAIVRSIIQEEVRPIVQEEVGPIIQEALTPLKKDIKTLKTDVRKIKKDINTVIGFFDTKDVELEKRLTIVETKVGIAR